MKIKIKGFQLTLKFVIRYDTHLHIPFLYLAFGRNGFMIILLGISFAFAWNVPIDK